MNGKIINCCLKLSEENRCVAFLNLDSYRGPTQKILDTFIKDNY